MDWNECLIDNQKGLKPVNDKLYNQLIKYYKADGHNRHYFCDVKLKTIVSC